MLGRQPSLQNSPEGLQKSVNCLEIEASSVQAEFWRGLFSIALGVGPHITPEISRLRLEPEDRVLLCSDGLSDMLSDQCLLTIFSEALPLPLLLTAFIGAANAAGGRDNIGVVLMEADIQLRPGQSDEAQRLQQADF